MNSGSPIAIASDLTRLQRRRERGAGDEVDDLDAVGSTPFSFSHCFVSTLMSGVWGTPIFLPARSLDLIGLSFFTTIVPPRSPSIRLFAGATYTMSKRLFTAFSHA